MLLTQSPRFRTVFAASCTILALAILPASASASKSQTTIFDATSSLVFNTDAGERQARLDVLKSHGTDTLRLLIPFRFVSPAVDSRTKPPGFDAANPSAYPAGAFDGLDATIRGATARGMRVLLEPAGPIPDWASASGRSDVANPKPKEFGLYVRALGRRYSGGFQADGAKLPRVRIWSIYNEPNQSIFLRPQVRNGKPYSPVLYRQLFLAAQSALAATGHGGDTILIGETAPSGGRDGVDPIPFLRGVLCLNAKFKRVGGCAKIRASGWAHHPYSLSEPPFRRSQNKQLINMATIDRLVGALAKAAKAGATTRRLPIYMTEFGVLTRPLPRFGVSFYKQVVYMAVSEYIAWQTPQIRTYGQYQLRDDPPSFEFSFTTGLETNAGRDKPSFDSFPMTLMARTVRKGKIRSVLLWGHVRPGNGRRLVTVRSRKGSATRVLKRVRTDGRGYFQFSTAFKAGTRYRAETTTGGRKLTGVFVAPISF